MCKNNTHTHTNKHTYTHTHTHTHITFPYIERVINIQPHRPQQFLHLIIDDFWLLVAYIYKEKDGGDGKPGGEGCSCVFVCCVLCVMMICMVYMYMYMYMIYDVYMIACTCSSTRLRRGAGEGRLWKKREEKLVIVWCDDDDVYGVYGIWYVYDCL